MPTPSKFTEARRRLILAALACGASRRTAAALAGIDHETLARWLRRGERSSPGSRWAEFHRRAIEAEAGMPRLGLLPLPAELSTAELRIAERLAFSEWAPADVHAEWPIKVQVSFSDATSVSWQGSEDA